MTKPLKVYGYTLGDRRRIVAAKSLNAAAVAFGISWDKLNTYGCETANDQEIVTATRQPGKVFYKPTARYVVDYIPE